MKRTSIFNFFKIFIFLKATAPVGAPLAGYNHGERRVKNWPVPHFTKYTTFMNPSVGVGMYCSCAENAP